ncbi:MAG: Uma2 family endonuclease [Cyanobacteria bacterium P01_A01_bin.70]
MRACQDGLIGLQMRIPDLLVLGDELATALEASSRTTITDEMPTPLLVVEVVLPGKVTEDRDYRYKRSEYGARGIPEYWIVDPEQQQISILTLVDGWYVIEVFEGDAQIRSKQFLSLALTADQVLSPTS